MSTPHQPPLPLGALLLFGTALSPVWTHAQSPTPAAKPPAAQEKELAPVKVKAEDAPDADKGYQPPVTRIGKLPQLPRDIPQSVTIVPEQLILDRNADTFRDALRNVPGVTFNAGEGGRIGDNITVRGFSVVGDLYRDGLRDIAQYNRDTFNVERIEVLRGSASMLFGRGSTGGVINQVSKEPLTYDRTSLTATAGTDAFGRIQADINRQIGQDAAIRVNAMLTDADSTRNRVHTRRGGLAPTVAWGIGTRNEFNVSAYKLEYDDRPDYGIPYYQGRPVDVPLSRFYGLDTDFQRDRADFLSGVWIHRFAGDQQVRTTLQAARYHRDLLATAPRLALPNAASIDGDSVINRGRQARGGLENTLTSQTDYSGTLNWGGVKHQLLAGVELAYEKAERWNQSNPLTIPATTLGSPNASDPLPANYFAQFSRTGQVSYQAETVAAYIQNTVEVSKTIKLLAGARRDQFSADYQRAAPQGPLERTDRVWSWRTGAMWQPNDESSYYVSYGTSFNPSGELYALDDRGANTPPEKNRNIEAGGKWELADGNLSLRTAIFRSEKLNERNTDLAVSIEQNLLTGKRHTDGVELEVAGRLTPQWEVFGGFARLSANIDRASGQQAATLDKTPLNTPRYTASLFTTYKLTPKFKIGGGYERVADRFANNTNTNVAPGYGRFDALIEFRQGDWTAKLNGFNLSNAKVYEGVYTGHVVPGVMRSFQLTVGYRY